MVCMSACVCFIQGRGVLKVQGEMCGGQSYKNSPIIISFSFKFSFILDLAWMKYIHNIDPFPNVPIIICKIIASYYTFKRVVQLYIFRSGAVFWLVEKTTCQSGSFNWTNNNLFTNCCVVHGCHSFPKPAKNPVLYCTITLYISTSNLDDAMCYLDVTKDINL